MIRRYRVGGMITLAAVILAGCVGSQPPMGATGAMEQTTTTRDYKTLYSFGRRSGDGEYPKAGLIYVNGILYGTTYAGGSIACAGGCGSVFEITPSGKKTTLYEFGGGTDGANPSASLLAVKGVLYGTTEYGSPLNVGAVFKISTRGVENVVYSFGPIPDGQNPVSSLIAVKGKLYGTTSSGGAGQFYGTVFRITTSGKEKVLHSFAPYPDGAGPDSSLVDVKGTLYGTTTGGGSLGSFGAGTVYSITATGTEQVIYAFGYEGSNGDYPEAALINVGGTMYGTTSQAGTGDNGTAFSITTTGDLTTLHAFTDYGDGGAPEAPLLNVDGTLYGTTYLGGLYGKGTAFKMSLGGKEKVLHSFGYGSDGAKPLSALIDVNGTLYGTTTAGGTYGDGTVFSLKP
jgi:uncharacterized repeat protein (TIGR03803 family)